MFPLDDGKLLGWHGFILKVSSAEEFVEIFQFKLYFEDLDFHLN